MIIVGKTLGRKKPLFDEWSIPPPDDSDGDDDFTLGDLIEHIVRDEVKKFRKRQHDRQFLRCLTSDEIERSAEKGKIEMGGSEVGIQDVDEDQSVAVAHQAFEDGLYLVIIDEFEFKSLQQPVYLTEDSRITFIRLTMLSGG